MLLEDPTRSRRRVSRPAVRRRTSGSQGGETIEAAGIVVRGDERARPLAGAPRVLRGRRLFSGDVLFAGSVGRTDLPGGDWDDVLERRSRRSSTRIRPRPSSTRATARQTTLDAELAAQPVPRRAARGGRRRERQDRAPARHARRRPAEMPLWQRITGEIERLCALYGYRKILTPVFEDTALFARTSGQGSDVVQKEMYTLHRPLRPLADAPARRGRRRSAAPTSSTGCTAIRSP